MDRNLIDVCLGRGGRGSRAAPTCTAIVRVEQLEERVVLSVPSSIISPVNALGWNNNAHGTGGHTESGGIGGADDRNAWDMNLNTPSWDSDKGVPVYAIADAYVERNLGNGSWGGNGYGQLLLKHLNSDGSVFYSGYLHMTDITGMKATQGSFIKAGTQIGKVGNVHVPDGNNHLHFAVYEWDGSKLRSRTTEIVQVSERPSNVTAPSAPSNVSGIAVSSSQVAVSWQDNASNEQGFKVYRWTGSWSLVGTVGANIRSFTVNNLSASTTHYFTVTSYNAAGERWAANYATVTTPATTVTPPAAPSNLSAVANSSTQATVAWQDNSANEQGFRVYRWTGSWTLVGTVGANIRSFTVGNLSPSTTNHFTVSAYNATRETWASTYVTVTMPAPTNTAPAGPSNVVWRATSSNGGYLTWSDSSNNESGFRVQYWNGSTWATLETVSANTTASRTYSLQRGYYYYFRVVSFNAAGETASSHVTVYM